MFNRNDIFFIVNKRFFFFNFYFVIIYGFFWKFFPSQLKYKYTIKEWHILIKIKIIENFHFVKVIIS